MNANNRDNIAVATAVAMVISGIFLSVSSFFLNHYTIHESILGYVGEALAFAGCIFGAHMYLKTKFSEMRADMEAKMMKYSAGQNTENEGENSVIDTECDSPSSPNNLKTSNDENNQ